MHLWEWDESQKNPCAITHHHEVNDEVLQENVMLRYTRDGNDLHVPRPLMTTVERLLETGHL